MLRKIIPSGMVKMLAFRAGARAAGRALRGCPGRGPFVSIPVVTAPPSPAPAERLAGIILDLCAAVAARGGGRDRLAGPLVVLIWTRLRRIAAQVAALAGRIAAGRHRHYPARRPPRRPAAPRRRTPPVLPHGFAWLLPLVPFEAAGRASQLRHLLAEPDMAALLDATPQMRRLLRPLCHMLGVRLPPPPAAASDPPPAQDTPAVAAPFGTPPHARTSPPQPPPLPHSACGPPRDAA